MPDLIQSTRRRPSPDPDLTPLIDVVFLLLIFFLVTSQFTQPTASLELPPGSPGPLPDESAIRVELTAGGDLLVNGSPTSDSEFEAALRQTMISTATRKVRFHGDRRIDYGRFVDLLDRARSIGIDDFSLIKSQEESNDQTPEE